MPLDPTYFPQNRGGRLLLLCLLLSTSLGLLYTFLNGNPIPSMRAKIENAYPAPAHNTDDTMPPSPQLLDGCPQYNKAGSIAFSVKTGATVAKERLPIQLVTTMRCVPDLMIFSDLNQTIGNHKIIDVLDRFSPDAMTGNPDFDLYHKQKEYVAAGREDELPKLGEIPIVENDWRTAGHSAAWGLDKYKFLHMVERAWEMRPDRDWYVFIEADTYLSIPTMEKWLATLDSSKKLYLGNAVRMWEHPTELYFNHGGSGIFMSGPAVKDLVVTHKGTPGRFDRRIRNWWYGDFILADALDEVCHIKATDAQPSIQADDPAMIPFGEHLWCKPAITLHHMEPKDFDEVYQFEQSRNSSELLFRDVFAATYKDGFDFRKEDWDNGSDDSRFSLPVTALEKDSIKGVFSPEELVDPHKSLAACEQACFQNEKCFQFSLVEAQVDRGDNKWEKEKKCRLSKIFKRGKAQKSTPNKKVDSGWRGDRIERWVSEHQGCNSGR